MADGHKDYSATPLWRKLGIAAGARVVIAGGPEGFEATLEDLAPLPPEIRFGRRAAGRIDVAVLFVTERRTLERRMPPLVRALEPAGGLWVAWPKKASGVPSDLDFDAVQSIGLAAGLVDNKSASVSETFQGLRFVRRREDRRR